MTWTDPHLQPGTGYQFTVVSFDLAQNHSAAGNAVTVTTLSSTTDTVAPSPPLNWRGRALTGSPTFKVRLDWHAATDSGGSGIVGYEVYRNDVLISGGSPVTTLYYEDTTSTPNTTFSYKLKSVDGNGNRSSFTNTVPVTTLGN